jgi:phospholipase C
MAATSGVASHVGTMVDNDNIFHQLQVAGKSWKAYEESMPSSCLGTSTSTYKPGHNPAYYYRNLRSPNTCATNDVPMSPSLDNDIANDTLPGYSWITPNECHVFYWVSSCSTPQSQRIPQGDAWLKALLPRLTAMPSYQAGKTLIVVTFDEGRESTNTNYVDCTDPAYYAGHADCQIPTVVVSPYIVSGTADGSDQNLYSLLGTTQDVLGLPRLGRAVGAPSMRPGLGF